MNRMNLGCGPDLKKGWDNVDVVRGAAEVMVWDARRTLGIEPRYDFVLINHMLCTMNFSDVLIVLQNVRDIMKPGAILQVIDMDVLKAFQAYQDGKPELIPAQGRTIDEQLCLHVSGYGTRKSLFTATYLMDLLHQAGFQNVVRLRQSKHDLRPNESLIMEAQR